MYNRCAMLKDALAVRNIVIAEAGIQRNVLNIEPIFLPNLRARYKRGKI